MTIRSYKMGPGTLTLDNGTPFDMTTQVTKMQVDWDESVTSTDPIPTLSGDELPGEDTASYAAKLAGEVIQDGGATSLVAWTWSNKGQTVSFTFTPSTTEGDTVTGQVRVVPLSFGGELNARNTAAIDWACPTEPTLTPGA